jgi:hypothetical protein
MKTTALVRKARTLLTLLVSSACGIEGIDQQDLFEEPPATGSAAAAGKVTHAGGSQGLVRPPADSGRGGTVNQEPEGSVVDPSAGAGGAEGGAPPADPPQAIKPSPSGGGGSAGSIGRGGASSVVTGGKANRAGAPGQGGSQSSAGAAANAGEGGAGGTIAEPEEPLATLLLTEYLEGFSDNKALEITALAGGSLDGCTIEVVLYGTTPNPPPLGEKPKTNTLRKVALAGMLAAGESYVVCDTDFALDASCDLQARVGFNGNDPIALICRGELVDSFGSRTEVPQYNWGEHDVLTINTTLRRRCEITAGDRNPDDAFVPELEWIAADAEALDDLGKHCAATPNPGPDVDPEPEPASDVDPEPEPASDVDPEKEPE